MIESKISGSRTPIRSMCFRPYSSTLEEEKDALKKSFESLPCPLSWPKDFEGMDTNELGNFNFATQLTLPGGQKIWEYMNHGIGIPGRGLVRLLSRGLAASKPRRDGLYRRREDSLAMTP